MTGPAIAVLALAMMSKSRAGPTSRARLPGALVTAGEAAINLLLQWGDPVGGGPELSPAKDPRAEGTAKGPR